MYQTIEAICHNGVIEPLEPVIFQEAEHPVIVRLPDRAPGSVQAPTPARVRGAMKGMLSSVDAFIEAKGDEIAREEDLREARLWEARP
uniref:DUF104 domain-containing protein n=1 Tax=Candidatus Kentrum sp. DK TaxID=2126562 RepID=A0A450S0M0_9GAMM|nr:MAG: hypothetical protein BECKDK2373B_GA0170837_100921 [Candidatus Kentron sp. DK]